MLLTLFTFYAIVNIASLPRTLDTQKSIEARRRSAPQIGLSDALHHICLSPLDCGRDRKSRPGSVNRSDAPGKLLHRSVLPYGGCTAGSKIPVRRLRCCGVGTMSPPRSQCFTLAGCFLIPKSSLQRQRRVQRGGCCTPTHCHTRRIP